MWKVGYRKFVDYHPRTDEKLYDELKILSRNPIYGDWVPNLLTNVGRDKLHKLGYIDATALERGFGCIGLTESTITPAATDTILAGEITTNGLARADASTKTHTSLTNTSTIEHTFTANAAFSTGVKAGALFNATSGGTMGHIFTFTNQPLVQFDQLRVSGVVTLG